MLEVGVCNLPSEKRNSALVRSTCQKSEVSVLRPDLCVSLFLVSEAYMPRACETI